MIFITVGSGRFDELIREIDRRADRLQEPAIAQIGRGRFLPRNMQYFRFDASLGKYYRAASLVIGHGGVGTVFEALRMHKPFIGVCNWHIPDDHQKELLRRLSAEKLLLWCRSERDIMRYVHLARGYKFRSYRAPECSIEEAIRNLIGANAVPNRLGRRSPQRGARAAVPDRIRERCWQAR